MCTILHQNIVNSVLIRFIGLRDNDNGKTTGFTDEK